MLLPSHHHQRKGGGGGCLRGLLSSTVGLATVALIPPFHIYCLWSFWHDYAKHVDKRACTCSCWDTVFKGPYESGVASYKHFYFNATRNTFKIWLMLATFLVMLYECIRWIVALWLSSRLRYSMALLFFTSLFSHYYSWWIYTNYYNDEFYVQWNYQLYFTISELVSTSIVLWLAPCERSVTLYPVIVIVSIAVSHVIASARDQFVFNVIRGEGHLHQIVRDIGFMIPDLLQIVIPLLSIRRRRLYC